MHNDEVNEFQIIRRSSYYDYDKFNDFAKENKDRFNILSTNIQSIISKFSELELFLEYLDSINFKFNVICMQETWKAEGDDVSQFMLQGYNCITQGKSSSSKGGLVIYIDDKYKADVISNLNSYEHWEGLIIKVNGGNLSKTLTIGNIYRPPKILNEHINAFINEFSSVVASLGDSNNELIFAGDFNINLLKINDNEVYSNFFDTLISHSLYPQITLPTRFTRTNGTLIDNFFCKLNKTILESKTGILTNKLSDHQPYFISLKITQKKELLPKYVKIHIVSIEAMHNVRHEIKSEEIYNKFNKKPTADPNSNYTTLCKEILRSKNKHMPSKWVKFNKYKHKKSSWITQGLLKSIKYRDKLYKRLKLTDPNSANYDTINSNLKTYNGILKTSIRAAKQAYFELCFNRFKNDIKNTWKTINDILSKTKIKKKSPTVIVENGVTHTDKLNIANKFNQFFTNIAHTLARDIKYDGTKNYKYYLNKHINTVFDFQNIDEETVMKTIQNLPSKNSCGVDGISSKLIKIIEPAIIKPLTLLINQVLNTGIFPDELKIAKVIPLFKKDDPKLLKNYRPISLLPTISKVIEKIIFTQLSTYFNENKLIFDNQYGFRPKHSTEYAALELVDRIITHMDNKEVPINIFLDLSKAFDTIDHTILLAKLRYYGIHDTALLLLKCYLNNRKQYVEFEDTKSDVLPITVGVPQGSILGPLLFIIYINDFSQASSIFNFIMYADDTTLFSNLKSFGNKIQTKEYLINAELSNVIEWLNINKLSLNKSKSKYMIFHVPNKDIQYLTLKIDNVIIEKVDEFSFLGLTVDTNLNWKRHS